MRARNPLTILAKPPSEVQAQIAALPLRELSTPTASLADHRQTDMVGVDVLTTGY
jgi:hypothetical protein